MRISLLHIKDIIGLSNNDPRTITNQFSFLSNNAPQFNLIYIIKLIIDRLKNNRNLLIDNGKSLFIDLESQFSEIDHTIEESLIEELEIIVNSNKEYDLGNIKDYCNQYLDFFEKKDSDDKYEEYNKATNKNVVLKAVIEEARLLIEISQEKNFINALKRIVKKYYDKEKILCFKFVYLTNHKNGINGIQVYNYIDKMNIIMQFNDKIETNKTLEEQVYKNLVESKKVQEDIKKSQLKIIEVLTVFIAIITIIIGNVSFIPQISAKTTLGAVSLILIINGSLIAGVSVMILLIAKITNSNIKSKCLCAILIIVVLVSLAGGIVLPIIENSSISINQDSTNNLTIENNINTLNSVKDEQSNNTTENVPINSPIIESTPTPSPNE